MFPQNITKCLAVLFILSTLLGTMKANDPLQNSEDSTPVQKANENEVQYRSLYEQGGAADSTKLADWLFYGKVPEDSNVPYVPEDIDYGYDYDTSLPYTESNMS